MTTKFSFSPKPYKKVKHVQFSLFSPEEIKRMSVCKVEHPVTFEAGKPKEGGLADLRMGAAGRDYRCATCESDAEECPGHFGHIELVKPMFHYFYLSTVVKILRCVCFHCGKLKTDLNNERFESAMKLPPEERLEEVYSLCKDIKICDEGTEPPKSDEPPTRNWIPHGGCGQEQPKISRDGLSMRIQFQSKPGEGMVDTGGDLSPSKVYDIFKQVSAQDCISLGLDPNFARPDWMIITVLAVPPPPVRPTIIMGAKKNEDDLTYKLVDIVKVNNQLKQQEENAAPAHVIREFTSLLQYHIATYFNNEIPGLPASTQRSGRPLKSICQRLKGKEGRVRGNLMGKRVDFSARSVITPDPNLSVDEVGVPRSIARNMTFPEIVTPYNLKEMQELVANGPDQLPGALYVVREDGTRDNLKFVPDRSDIHLSYGDRVERHLKDGDYIIFNRQPSLHKMSMMGHRIRIMPWSTFRLNLSVTTPYNADFDGDEMNLHVPQNMETRAEVRELMMVPKQIVSPQSNSPVIGLVQDSLLACALFTYRDCFLDKKRTMNLLMWIPSFDGTLPTPAILKPEPLWTGKQLFSMILPDVNYSNQPKKGKEPRWLSPSDSEVLIERGVILCGVLNKSTVGRSEGGLVHIIWTEYGSEAAKFFLNQAQQLVNNWLVERGYTIGVGDTIADSDTNKRITDILASARKDVNELISSLHHNQLEVKSGMTLVETFEHDVNVVLNTAITKAGNEARTSISRENNIKTMVNAGSKGSALNIAQMIACVGQQNVEGRRIPFGFRQRTLPHFPKDDYTVESRGFVENSYLRGLTPQEFFFHAMGGREGIIDTAVKTSETGYIQRRLVKAMEDVMVHYDGTVRNSLGEVIQFVYGEDGMDALHIEKQKLKCHDKSDEALRNAFEYNFGKPNLGLADGVLEPELLDQIKNDPHAQEILQEEFKQIWRDRAQLREEIFPGNDTFKWPLPVNIMRLITNAKSIFKIDPYAPSDLQPHEVVQKVQQLCKSIKVIAGDCPVSREAQSNATLLFWYPLAFCLVLEAIDSRASDNSLARLRFERNSEQVPHIHRTSW
eukprot:TRINITY_DN4101_c0_g1_i1.p1 TRINITY_DN4101_c0_g1~~TRINITY_DN4101_c0_g1_i1.p1  ORF type:complete len:1066 (+),score=189.66 TRINITY_DN4101_c0_g1_i1:92-3289(+)